MAKALYRKYRSTSLDEVVGQEHVTDILTRSLKSGMIAHAYLLTGPRGVGKTSIARILAFEINKLPYSEDSTNLDIIEIDAASNNGVENIRDLIERVQVAPVAASKKIYIIDEVHMLSKSAFNALLKTLEEPPEHAVFILATTDVDKLPATIVSRTQRFSFRAIAVSDAIKHLRTIADKESISIDDDALELIAVRGDGSFRDSISLLDQLQSLTDKGTTITKQLVEASLGLAPTTLVDTLLDAYTAKDLSLIIQTLDNSEKDGIQTSVITSQLIQTIRRRIPQSPQLLPLMDQLLSVAKSTQPSIKLLTVLALHAVPKPKTAALTVSAPTISAPLAELERQATKARPSVKNIILPVPEPTPAATAEPHQQAAPEPVASSTQTGPGEPLDWDALIEYTRANFVAIYSVLRKCNFTQDGNLITLYTGSVFWKNKLDASNHRINLVKSMEQIGATGLTIETIGSPPPPKDSTAASVAAIMGGGEEVQLDD
ncbi:MAG: DNA polymerase III subunit gamma/tau [Candidatus Saccharimonadales bacterium]